MGSGVLLLRLAGPLQLWGDCSRFTHRETRSEPTKSGIIGMLACAQGRTREDSIEDLLQLSFGVRIDQKGNLIRDLQTEKTLERKRGSRNFVKVLPLTQRYYLADARFLAAIEAPREMLNTLEDALRHPRWPLYLGRRSCPPAYPLNLGIHDEYESIDDALTHHPWQASGWYRRCHTGERLEIVRDARHDEQGSVQNDMPLTFSQRHREYGGRSVKRYFVDNPDASENVSGSVVSSASFEGHDPMFFA